MRVIEEAQIFGMDMDGRAHFGLYHAAAIGHKVPKHYVQAAVDAQELVREQHGGADGHRLLLTQRRHQLAGSVAVQAADAQRVLRCPAEAGYTLSLIAAAFPC